MALFSCKKDPDQNITNEYYEIVQCDTSHVDTTGTDSVTAILLPAEFQEWANIFEGEGVGAAVNLYEDILILFNSDGDRFAWFEDQEIKAVYDLSTNNHVLENCPFSSVSAAVLLNGNDLYVFDADDNEYCAANNFIPENTPGSWDDDDFLDFQNPYETWLWGNDYSFPFNTAEAAWNYSNDGGSCFDATEDTQYTWISSGNEVAKYDTWGSFEDEFDIENWTAENNCGGPDGLIPFENIGAACRYTKPNMIQEIFFSEDGTQFCYYNVSEGIFSEIYDLY